MGRYLSKGSDVTNPSSCTLSTPSLLDNLPTELLELIISFILQASLKDLAPLLRVCRKWHGLALPLVWQDVVLTKSNISSFSSTITKYTRLAGRPRSLTLDIHLSYDEYSLTYKVAEYIKRLTNALPHMDHLETFSLKHHVDQSSPFPASAMTNDLILGLVSALPSSVRNLEIDSAVMYFTHHTGSLCLCSTLSTLLPHLNSLRLAYPRICSKLLDNPSSTLRYLVINGIMQHFRPGIRGCDVAGEQARLSWDALQEQRITISIATVRSFLHTVQEKVLGPSTMFPRLKSLIVLEPYYFIPSGSMDFFLTNVHSVTPDDNGYSTRIVSQCFPTWMDDQFQYLMLRRCAHQPPKPKSLTSTAPPHHLSHHHHQHHCSHHDIGGSFSELRTLLEGPTGWITTAHNARTPHYLNPWTPDTDTLLNVEAPDFFEQWGQRRDWQSLQQQQPQQYCRLKSEYVPRKAWHTGGTTPVYTVFRSLTRFDPSDIDLVHRANLGWCRCRKCERLRNSGISDQYHYRSHQQTHEHEHGQGEQELWEPTPMEHFFANKVWRAEAGAKRVLLCGRVYDDDHHQRGVPADLKPEDFELREGE